MDVFIKDRMSDVLDNIFTTTRDSLYMRSSIACSNFVVLWISALMQESSLEALEEYIAATMIRYLGRAFTRSRMRSFEMKVAGEKLEQVN